MGRGQRFKDSGYTVSKPMVKSYGKEILFWLLDVLDHKNNNILIVCRSDSSGDRMSEKIKSRYHDSVNILSIDGETKGAAHTLQLALESNIFNIKSPIAVCDSDTFYSEEHIEAIKNSKNSVFYFTDTGKSPLFSYVETDDSNIILRIVEKQKISDKASVGTYCFESGEEALKYCKILIDKGETTLKEYYVSGVIQSMIEDGHRFQAIEVKDFNCLGTPGQLQGLVSDKKLRVCFDLDNTLVTEPQIPGDYSSVLPIIKNINYLRFLKSQGHTIILQTARRMKTHSGNVGKLCAEIGPMTFKTLEKFDIPYDEIYFGKPYADAYIDDKAIDAYGDLEKMLGIYTNELISREHNYVQEENTKIVKISSNRSIKGELYWYLNTPEQVQHLFPRLENFKESEEEVTLEIEKIYGSTLSKSLTIKTVRHSHIQDLVSSLKLIHGTGIENSDVDIYQNYLQKFKVRHSQIVSILGNEKSVKELSQNIINFLSRYEERNQAIRANIHGDPVFTNIILDKNNRLKFIDMRGIQGDTLTITGDSNYDWAKVYQSLVGYDYLIRSMKIDKKYLYELQEEFFELTCIDKKTINGLTASLLYTCIPLQPISIMNELIRLSNVCIEKSK